MQRGLPLVPCAPWCEDHDGHPRDRSVQDQCCFSEDSTVGLTLEPLLHDEPSKPMLDYMSAYLAKYALHAAPHVHLGRNQRTGVQLTLDEARRLGEALIDLAALGEK